MNKAAKFTSVWSGGEEITTNCKVNLETKEVSCIEEVSGSIIEDLGFVTKEYVTIDGSDYRVLRRVSEDEYEDCDCDDDLGDNDYWYWG